MKENYKKLLMIWLILYFVFTVFRIINTFNNTILDNLFSIGTFPLHISAIILFVYVGNRGEDKICKFGVISIIIYCTFYIAYKLSLYSLNVTSLASFKDKLLSIVYYTSNNCISICEMVAILSLVKSNSKIEKYKTIAVVCIVLFSGIGLLNNLIPATSGKFLLNIKYSLDYISTLARYAAIILCLTDDNFVSNIFITNQSLQQSVLTNPVNVNQPLKESIPQTPTSVSQPIQEAAPQVQTNVSQPVQNTTSQAPTTLSQLVSQSASTNPVSANQQAPQVQPNSPNINN